MNKENGGRTYSGEQYDREPWSIRTGSGDLILESTNAACHANKVLRLEQEEKEEWWIVRC